MTINILKNLSWVYGNSTASTEVVNKEHESLIYVSSKLEYYDCYSIDDNIWFTALKIVTVQLTIMRPEQYDYHGFTISAHS